jgi:acyl-coenzyme A synthetase/AMP-(fatty) acid ligase
MVREHKLQFPSLVEVRVAGSLPSQNLVSAIHNDLGVPVKSVYGSTEGGGVAVRMLKPGEDTSDIGDLVPGIELEIQPENGSSGLIRYRGPGVSPGYLEDSNLDSSFKDGWFYPGDSGHISSNGHLVLEGRADELINVGGTKLNPAVLEDLANEFDGVLDSAVCLIERVPGIDEVSIAIVGNQTVDMRRLDQILRAKFPIGHPTIFVKVGLIPRNRMGKIVRDELKGQILSELKLN